MLRGEWMSVVVGGGGGGAWGGAARALLATVALVVLLDFAVRLRDWWRYRAIPGPTPIPILGNMIGIARSEFHLYIEECRKRYGSIFKIWVGPRLWIVVTDPAIARIVNHKFLNRVKMPQISNEKDGLFGESGLVGARNDMWRMLRLNWQIAFRSGSLEGYSPVMNKCALQLADKLSEAAKSGTAINIHEELGNMTMHVVGTSAYGVDFRTLDTRAQPNAKARGQRLVAASRTIFSRGLFNKSSIYQSLAMVFPILTSCLRAASRVWPDRNIEEIRKAGRVVQSTSKELIRDWRSKDEVGERNGSMATEHHDGTAIKASGVDRAETEASVRKRSKGIAPGSFLGLMLGATDFSKTRTLTDGEVVAQVSTFLLAGYETTANALSFAIYNISAHKDAELRLLQEIDSYFAGEDKELPNSALDKQFPWAESIINETLRLFPPATLLSREVAEDLQLGPYHIYKGCSVFTGVYSYQRDTSIWPDATSFKPQRFLPDHQELSAKVPNAHTPFGAGPRMCVGWRFAMQEAKIALVRLYQHYTFELIDKESPLKTEQRLTLSPKGGVFVKVLKRESMRATG